MGKLGLYHTESEDMETNRNLKQPAHRGYRAIPRGSIEQHYRGQLTLNEGVQAEPLKLAILMLDRVAGREKSPVEWIGILQDFGRRQTPRRWFGRT
jgi:hypothetical protein